MKLILPAALSDRLSIYASLGIGEVWRFDGEDLFIYVLQNGVYELHDRSNVLSILTKKDVLRFLQKRKQMGENALLREFRQWLQNHK